MCTINIILHTAGSVNMFILLWLYNCHVNTQGHTQTHNLFSVIIILYNIDFRGKQMWYMNNNNKLNENSFVISEFYCRLGSFSLSLF